MIPIATDPVSTLVFFLVIFAVVGAFFLFIHLVMGSVIRPNRPDAEKLTIYECGEPTVGSAWVQFDLRYYVVALLFVIFDVEVAFFFPWATVFGTANQIANFESDVVSLTAERKEKLNDPVKHKDRLEAIDVELDGILEKVKGLSEPLVPSGLNDKVKIEMGFVKSPKFEQPKEGDQESGTRLPQKLEVVPIDPSVARGWAQIAFFDIAVFFGVLMVGFAYVWRRGDIDWVRAYQHHKEPPTAPEKPLEQKVETPQAQG